MAVFKDSNFYRLVCLILSMICSMLFSNARHLKAGTTYFSFIPGLNFRVSYSSFIPGKEIKAITFTLLLPIEFFVGFLDILESDLLVVAEESRVQGRILGTFNSTFLVLIPKKDRALNLDDYRAISLCNVDIRL